MFKPSELFDLSQTAHSAIFGGSDFAWDALKAIREYLRENLKPELRHHCIGRAYIGEQVQIGEGTVVEDGVMIKGPAIIGKNCELRHSAYIRENVIVGDNCVIGNSTELKNCVLFNQAVAPHFNYIGDSILGWKAHLGAGVKISNFKLVPGSIGIEHEGAFFDTGLRKFGALIGDEVEVGCNAVLNPGSIIGPRCIIYANTNWRGVLAADSIVKNKAPVHISKRLTQ